MKKRSEDRVKHRKKFIYRVAIKWESIDGDGRAKGESDYHDVSRECRQSLRGRTGGVQMKQIRDRNPLFTITKSSRI